MENKKPIESRCPVMFPDTPSGEDELGSHKRLAEAISRLIREDPIGKAICLNGTWGSGKSTVVELLRKTLEKDKNVGIVTFESWAHQGDPLRLSFLDELLSHFEHINWEVSKVAKTQLEGFRNPQSRTVTTVTPQFSWPAVFFALSIPVALIGNSLLGRYGTGPDTLFNTPGLWIFPWWSILLFLSMLPLIVVTISFFLKRNLSDFVLFFQQLPVQQLNLGEPNPTSVHYRTLFHDMLESVLAKQKEGTLVIVLDNLDRIEPRTAFEILATMKTFMDPFLGQNEEFLRRVWLLVPLDRDALEHSWLKANGELKSMSAGSTEHECGRDQDRRDNFVKPFLDKQFQVTFDVPSPVLVRWKEFFRTKLGYAFARQHVSEEELEGTFHIFDFLRKPEKRHLAPRDIILFMNRLVGVYHTHSDFPLPVLAVYVLKSREIHRVLECVEDPCERLDKIVEARAKALLNEYINVSELPFYLAALHYVTDISIAKHMVIGEQLFDALISANEKLIDKYSTIPGFEAVLKKIFPYDLPDWAEREPGTIAKVAAALGPVLKLGSLDSSIGSCLLNAAGKVARWVPFDDSVAKGIISLVEHSEDKGFIEAILLSASESVSSDQEVESAIAILDHLVSNRQNPKETFPVRASYPEFLVRLAKHPRGKNLSERMELLEVNLEDLCRDILRKIATGTLADSHFDPFEILPAESTSWPWDRILEVHQSHLEKNDSILGSCECLMSLAVFGEDKVATRSKKLLIEWCKRDFLASRIANLPKDERETGTCYFEFIKMVVLDIDKMDVPMGSSGGILRQAFRETCENVDPNSSAVSTFSRLTVRYRMQARIRLLAGRQSTFFGTFFDVVNSIVSRQLNE
jgi:hypothetical protein